MPDFVTVKDFDPSEYPSSVGTYLDRKHYLEWWTVHFLMNAIQCIKNGQSERGARMREFRTLESRFFGVS